MCVSLEATLLTRSAPRSKSDEIVAPTLSTPAQPGRNIQLSDGRLRETVAQLDAGKKAPWGVSVAVTSRQALPPD